MSDERTYSVPEGLGGERFDVGLARLTGLSRSKAGEIIDAGVALVDGQVRPRSHRLVPEAALVVDVPAAEPAEARPTPVDMDVVFEDDDLIVVDKPAGVAAHPSVGWDGPDVVGALKAARVAVSTFGPPERQGIVHRLDVGTSGLMVVAKSERAYRRLKAAFKDRTVTKVYHALVQGHPLPVEGTIDAPIRRDHRHSWRMAVVSGGRDSITHYRTLETMAGGALLEVHLETGRTHQIRVHMAATHHPCMGDPLYGSDPTLAAKLGLDRQWLHARTLGFVHPGTNDYVEFSSDYPRDLALALERMRQGDLW